MAVQEIVFMAVAVEALALLAVILRVPLVEREGPVLLIPTRERL